MGQIYVVYWTQSGNTKSMTDVIGQGTAEAEKSIVLFGLTEGERRTVDRDRLDRMSVAGTTGLNGKGLIYQEMPDDSAIVDCVNLRKQLAVI